jgi:hypothetical protein
MLIWLINNMHSQAKERTLYDRKDLEVEDGGRSGS